VVRKGDLSMRPPMAAGGMRARETAGCSLYSRAAPSLRLEARTLHLPRSTAAILDLCAQGPASDRWAPRSRRVRRGTKMRLAFRGRQAQRGPTALTSRRWGASPHGHRGGRGSLSTARGAGTPGSSPALWRRSRARTCCFPAGQHDFDCEFFQKVELCDKKR
jgi:hypothetical protein